MEVEWFLKERTRFIRYFYDNAAPPFREMLRKIEEEEEPFIQPYNEDGDEPAFQIEYQEAWYGLEAAGIASISMLSDTLKTFFLTWQRLLGFKLTEQTRRQLRKKGLIPFYKQVFGEIVGGDWKNCPVDFGIIEQVILARNDAQHSKDLHSRQPAHNPQTRKRYVPPFFISEHDKVFASSAVLSEYATVNLQVSIARADLFAAIAEVEKLADWLEPRLQAVLWPNGLASPNEPPPLSIQ
ncbi:hypothetical protein LJR009_002256 [Bosea sp. LjRoot9]|uniref:hypothetical protein n=1 Tax=Bosea sp. LjRoot9 TaxID=3342341 RepID=UPI003ED09E7D